MGKRYIVVAVILMVTSIGGFVAFSENVPEAQADGTKTTEVMGNSEDEDEVAVPNPAAPVYAPEYEIYVAQKGDSMWGIAYKYGMTIDELMLVNVGHTDRVRTYCERIRAKLSPEELDFLDNFRILCNGQLMTSDSRMLIMARESVLPGWQFAIPWDKFQNQDLEELIHRETCRWKIQGVCQTNWI